MRSHPLTKLIRRPFASQIRMHGPVWPISSDLVVFAGGYGGGEYEVALQLFCDAVITSRGSSLRFVFSPHPGYSSSVERALFVQWGCLPTGAASDDTLKVVSNTSDWGGLSTPQLVSAAQASVSAGSTVGAQSLAVGVPHAYVSSIGDAPDNVSAALHGRLTTVLCVVRGRGLTTYCVRACVPSSLRSSHASGSSLPSPRQRASSRRSTARSARRASVRRTMRWLASAYHPTPRPSSSTGCAPCCGATGMCCDLCRKALVVRGVRLPGQRLWDADAVYAANQGCGLLDLAARPTCSTHVDLYNV